VQKAVTHRSQPLGNLLVFDAAHGALSERIGLKIEEQR
jgi:hypothetical protein